MSLSKFPNAMVKSDTVVHGLRWMSCNAGDLIRKVEGIYSLKQLLYIYVSFSVLKVVYTAAWIYIYLLKYDCGLV